MQMPEPEFQKPSLFVSYAHEDQFVTRWISTELESLGFEIFLDEQKLHLGDSLSSSLEEAVTTTDIFVLLITNSTLRSEWARFEFDLAFKTGRRACPVYLSALQTDTHLWPELRSIISLDATNSLAEVVPRVAATLPNVSGATKNVSELLREPGVSLNLCFEILNGVIAAIQRHLETDCWNPAFSLQECFLWTANFGTPPLVDTHLYISPNREHLMGHKTERSVLATLATSMAKIIESMFCTMFNDVEIHEDLTELFAKTKIDVDSVYHRRLFTFISLLLELKRSRFSTTVSDFLRDMDFRCRYPESPTPRNRDLFNATFQVASSTKQTISAVIISHSGNMTLKACLEAIQQQSKQADEIILVEDDNRPNADSLGTTYDLNAHVCLPLGEANSKTRGRRAACRRIGTMLASKKVILYVDGDTIIGPDVISILSTRLGEWSECDYPMSVLVPDIEFENPEEVEVEYEAVMDQIGAVRQGRGPSIRASVGASLLRTWYDSQVEHGRTIESVRGRGRLSWRNVKSRCWAVARRDVLSVGNWDAACVGWGAEETDLAYRLEKLLGMQVGALAQVGAYAVHVRHRVNRATQLRELAINEARFIAKFPEVRGERIAVAERLGIASAVIAALGEEQRGG